MKTRDLSERGKIGAGWAAGVGSDSWECRHAVAGLKNCTVVYNELGTRGGGPVVQPEHLTAEDLRRETWLSIDRLAHLCITEAGAVPPRPLVLGETTLARMRRCGIRRLPVGCPHGHWFSGTVETRFHPAVPALRELAGERVRRLLLDGAVPAADAAFIGRFMPRPRPPTRRAVEF